METAVQTTQPIAEVTGLPIVLRLRPVLDLTDDQLFELCQINDVLRIERTAEGELLIMPPAGAGTGHRNMKISVRLVLVRGAKPGRVAR